MVCDNTHLCRIAGYSSDAEELGVTVLLERKAGPKEQRKAKVQLSAEPAEMIEQLPSSFQLEMLINDKSYGFISMSKALIAALSKKQTQALIASLKKSSTIIWRTKNISWKLSDKGASAVLLKTDEYQKRIGTVGALSKKGKNNENNVLKAKPIPVIYAQAILKKEGILIEEQYKSRLEKETMLNDEECSSSKEEKEKLTYYNLSSNKLLVSRLCWRAAYNEGYAFWVTNKKPPFNPALITTSGTDYSVAGQIGTISNSQKGRGIGDCWSYESFVWTGETFQLSSEGTTGFCKGFAGGAWNLPTFVSKIRVR